MRSQERKIHRQAGHPGRPRRAAGRHLRARAPAGGPPLDPEINGRELPFGAVPVQGFSSLVPRDGGQYVALQDNGFGTLANSPDYPLGWFHLHLDLEDPPPDGGPVAVEDYVDLVRSPNGRSPSPSPWATAPAGL